jgi:hypothetical protein
VIGAAVAHAARDLGQLRADDGGRQVLHPHVVERQHVLPAREGLGQLGVVLAPLCFFQLCS